MILYGVNEMIWIILFTIGLIGGMIGSLVGLGGGIIIVPSLLFIGSYTEILHDFTTQMVVGTSVFILIFTGLSSTLSYLKQKKVDFCAGLTFFIGSGPGAIIGAWLNKKVDGNIFEIMFGVLIIIISIFLHVKKYMKPLETIFPISRYYIDESGKMHHYSFHLPIAIGFSFLVGTLSGLFGIGGGSLMVPFMLLLFRFPPPVAVATSMFLVFLSSIVGSTTHIVYGNVNWLWTIALVPGAWIGGWLGARLNARLRDHTVITIFRVLLIFVGLKLII